MSKDTIIIGHSSASNDIAALCTFSYGAKEYMAYQVLIQNRFLYSYLKLILWQTFLYPMV
jgi:hypothetical protein